MGDGGGRGAGGKLLHLCHTDPAIPQVKTTTKNLPLNKQNLLSDFTFLNKSLHGCVLKVGKVNKLTQ